MFEVTVVSSDIKSVLQSYIRQGKELLSQYESSRKRIEDFRSELTRDGLGELAGLIAGVVVPGTQRKVRKYSRKIMRGQQKTQIVELKRALSSQFEPWFNSMMEFLSSISIKKAHLKQSSNSELLKRKFNKIHGYVNPETKIRNTVLVLEKVKNLPLIYNTDIPKTVGKKKLTQKIPCPSQEPYKILKELETKMRKCIHGKLESISKNWWKERVPKDVKDRAESRKNKNEKQYPWHKGKNLPLVFYIDFTDYVKIILRRDNWRDEFQKVFKDKEIISAKLRELEPIRNAIAHFRKLTQTELSKLKLYSEDICSCIEKS
jgi:hypothetical protein